MRSVARILVRGRKRASSRSGSEKAFGKVLREIRLQSNLSQEQLAEDSDIDRTFVGMLERGLTSPSLRTFLRLSEALRVSPCEMMQRLTQEMKRSKPKRC